MKKEYIDKTAKVLVRVGVNLHPGHTLVLQSDPDALDLARAVTKEAFEAGAKDVIVIINDPEIDHIRAKYASKETLRNVPEYKKEQIDYYLRDGNGLQMGLMGTHPTLMADVPEENAIALAQAGNDVRNVIRKYIHEGTLQWTGTCYANKEWAVKVYPELDEDAALSQLEDDIALMMRVDQDDPVKAWEDHCNRLAEFGKKLNEKNFKSLHITTGLGTDIEMDLVEGHIWTSAGTMGEGLTKYPYVANMPTEEVFTDPNRFKVNGIAYASRPLTISGKMVRDFWIRFEDGLAVDCGASEGEGVLRAQLFRDETTRRLGEVALVSKQSAITKLNRVYYNGLIDENAASHLAFGSSFPSNIKGGASMSQEELMAKGVNFAPSHNDFMIGTLDMKVVGTTYDGRQITVMEEGDFVF
ncbi:MAG: aminopeptidase [Erysipelotrichaceae bacterium]|nr:aminopeptidase [Erysipelotrichaceae bacterium]